MAPSQTVSTELLDVAVEVAGPVGGQPVVLLHGFPYDVRSFDEVASLLADDGFRVYTPALRGFGGTRFRSEATARSGQQAALGSDLIELLDALKVESAIVAGFDWGGRAACIAAALWPQRVSGLVSVGGYAIQDIAHATSPSSPADEATYWYQFYFHSERGRRGLEANRDELCKKLWVDWSPRWSAAASAFKASAGSLHNPDFVDVVIHSYRHRFGLVGGDARYDELEARLAELPRISVPTVVIESGADGVAMPAVADDREFFTGPYREVHLADAGHNVPQEAPEAFAEAIRSLAR